MQRTNALLIKYGGSTKLTDLPASFQATLKAAEPALESKVGRSRYLHCPFRRINIMTQYSKLVEGKIQYVNVHESQEYSPRPDTKQCWANMFSLSRGNKPHKSHKDDKDDKDVITVSYHTAKGTRITSIHAHDDNTWKEFPSRNASKGQ